MTQALCPTCGQWTGVRPQLAYYQIRRFEEIYDKYYRRLDGYDKSMVYKPKPLSVSESGDLIDMVTYLKG